MKINSKYIAAFLSGMVLMGTLAPMLGGVALAERRAVTTITTLAQSLTFIDFLGEAITDAGAITGTTITATSTTATSSVAYRLQVGTTTAPTITQLQLWNPKTSPSTIATSTLTIGDPVSTSTSRSGITLQSDYGSTTCAYVDGTSTVTWKLATGACATN